MRSLPQEVQRILMAQMDLPLDKVADLANTMVDASSGIVSTLNYLDLTVDSKWTSPGLRPYPNLRVARSLTSVYRTRADKCGRLWMVDNGLIELPNNLQQLQQPAIVVFDLNTDQLIMRYPLKPEHIIAANTPAGLASITIDIVNDDCSNTYAYIPDLATYGLIVYSLKENDSWRFTHNFFHFNPLFSTFRIQGQEFQWNDGIFSITLMPPTADSCRAAYFHPLAGTDEFAVNTCVLRNRTADQDPNYWRLFTHVGNRGDNSQCTTHDVHANSSVIFFADVGRDAISCWYTGSLMTPANVAVLAQSSMRLAYPGDVHITGDEVWVITNAMPRWAYSRLIVDDYNFYIYKGNAYELIEGTVCDSGRTSRRN